MIPVQLHQLDYSGNNSKIEFKVSWIKNFNGSKHGCFDEPIHDYIIFQFESNPSNSIYLDIFSDTHILRIQCEYTLTFFSMFFDSYFKTPKKLV